MTTSGTNDNLKVKKGDNLSAKRWNRIVDRLSENEHATGTTVGTLHQDIVFGKASADVELGEVRGLGDFYGDPDAIFDIGDGDIVDLALPVFPTSCHMLLIPRQPIESDEVGPCVYAGGAVVRFREETTQPSGNYCFPDPDDPTYMKKSTSGYKIATVVSDDYAVAVMSDVQQLWKFELTQNHTGGATAPAKLLTLEDEEFAASVDIKMLDCGPLDDETVGYCMFAQGEFHLVEICQGGSGVGNRIRFRLKTGFEDTGQADAIVLNTYGATSVSAGDIVTVNDTQKQFAHAIGIDQITMMQSSVFPCGGSIGFAVMTEKTIGACTIEGTCTDNVTAGNCTAENGTFNALKNCADEDITPVKQWEVESCSQTVNRMRVYVYRHQATHSQPTGETNEGAVTLFFNNSESILSRFPNVDYDLGILDNSDANVPYDYKIEAHNDGRFSAIQGSLVTIQATPEMQRLQDGCNDSTPYPAQSFMEHRWQIEEVHSPLARWIAVKWKKPEGDPEASPAWEYDNNFLEGDDPLLYFENGITDLNAALKTLPGLDQTCLKLDEPGWAFWDPNEQEYNVAVTKSAMYGTATTLDILGKKPTEDGELLEFDDCDLKYKQTTPWFVFGDGDECPAETTDKTATADLVPVQNIYDVSRVGDYLHFSYNTIYVCKTDPGGVDTEYVCCPDEQTGCCENYDGTYTPDQTQADCENAGGTYLGDGSDCPEPPSDCLECVHCSECAGVILTNPGLKTGASNQANFQESTFVATNCEMTSGCTLTCTGTWTNDAGLPPVAATVTFELKTDANGDCYVELSATPANVNGFDVDGWKLFPTGLGTCCEDGYGESAGGPANQPTAGQGNDQQWDELEVHAECCEPEGGGPGGGGP